MTQLYDTIGAGYGTTHRRPDPRLAAAITRALSQAASVVNVGAGAGSYEPVSGASGGDRGPHAPRRPAWGHEA